MNGERVSLSSGPASSTAGADARAASPPSPVDLRLVAVTPDRAHLVLEDSAGQQYRLPWDERLVAALRSAAPRDPARHARIGQLEIALESQLSPREIQARIRAGHSVDEVSLAAGISAERVERYAGPVVAERQHVVEQAQKAPGRRANGGSAPALAELVEARLADQQASPESTEWDAWRGDDDERWTVRLSYLAATRARVATWTFDPRSRVLTPADEEARWLVDEARAERLEDAAPTAVRRLTSIPGAAEAVASAAVPSAARSRADEVYDREADERSGSGSSAPSAPSAPSVSEPARPAAASARSRRPAVPSFDDIMFGPRRRD